MLWDVLAKQLPVTWQVHYADTLEAAHTIIQKSRSGD
jgi:hypothetical protein